MYHWEIIVYLTFLASLTHLTTLTFLRRYLYLRPAKRLWRLVVMFLLIIMVVASIVPTGTNDWHSSNRADENDRYWSHLALPALCYFSGNHDTKSHEYKSMIISIIILLIKFSSQAIRLHRKVAKGLVECTRRPFSRCYRTALRLLRSWTEEKNNALSIPVHNFIYRRCSIIYACTRTAYGTRSFVG
jgi:hypothetical protein